MSAGSGAGILNLLYLLFKRDASGPRSNESDVVQLSTPSITTMINSNQKILKVFLCHSSNDKMLVRGLFERLKRDGFSPWLDEEQLLPGQDWNLEITKAVRNSHVVIVCLSSGSVGKTGYVQKEIKYALDVADEQPEDSIFIIPLKLEECAIPERLRRWQWVNLFEEFGYMKLLKSLNLKNTGI